MNQWDYKKNVGLNPKFYAKGSNEKVWWKCSKGEDHEWECTINERSRGRGCPYCAGKRVGKGNNFKVKKPMIAKEWHPIKNESMTPEQVTMYSSKKVWLKNYKNI